MIYSLLKYFKNNIKYSSQSQHFNTIRTHLLLNVFTLWNSLRVPWLFFFFRDSISNYETICIHFCRVKCSKKMAKYFTYNFNITDNNKTCLYVSMVDLVSTVMMTHSWQEVFSWTACTDARPPCRHHTGRWHHGDRDDISTSPSKAADDRLEYWISCPDPFHKGTN